MYARVQTTCALPPTAESETARAQVTDMIAAHPGFAGIYLMRQVGIHRHLMLTLWETREDAELASTRSEAARGPRPFPLETDEVYEVRDEWTGAAAGEAATTAAILSFDGPLSPAWVASADRAAQERVKPALAGVPGLTRSFVLWHPEDRKSRVVHLATSVEAIEEGGRAVQSTRLLPGEDPALLTGPDRLEVYRVAGSVDAPRHDATTGAMSGAGAETD